MQFQRLMISYDYNNFFSVYISLNLNSGSKISPRDLQYRNLLCTLPNVTFYVCGGRGINWFYATCWKTHT